MSSCLQAYTFSIASSKPCTNVPIRCTLCPEIHWKYNLLNHLTERHPSWQSQVNAQTRQAWEISDEERRRFASGRLVQGTCRALELWVYLNKLRMVNGCPCPPQDLLAQNQNNSIERYRKLYNSHLYMMKMY